MSSDLDKFTQKMQALEQGLNELFAQLIPVINQFAQGLIIATKSLADVWNAYWETLPTWVKLEILHNAEIVDRKERHRKKYNRMAARKRGKYDHLG